MVEPEEHLNCHSHTPLEALKRQRTNIRLLSTLFYEKESGDPDETEITQGTDWFNW